MFEQYADEFKEIGRYRSGWGKDITQPKRNYPITEKENFLLMLRGEKPVWLPAMGNMTDFSPRLIPDHLVRAWVLDANPLPMGGEVIDGVPFQGGYDMFGVYWEFVPITGGSMVRPGAPLIPDITHWEDYVTFPDLASWDWQGSSDSNKEILPDSRLVRTWLMTGLNERIISMMDFGNVMIAYVDEDLKPAVHRFFDKLCDFYDELIGYYRKYYGTDVLMFNDDWGTQHGPQFSLDTAREILVPYLRRLVESCHKHDMWFELHSCGLNDMIAPAFAEAGVDLWFPQENLNDFDKLYRLIGDKVLIGMITNAREDMTDDEIMAVAEDFMEKYGQYGHVILHPGFPPNGRLEEYVYYLSRQAFSV